jgi:hypothetical protein
MVSLNDINAEVDEQFGPFVVEDVAGGDVYLRNVIRLHQADRVRVSAMQKQIKDADGDVDKVLELAKDMLRIVGDGDGGERLVNELGDDPSKLMYVLNLYVGATQVGEASRSES